MKNRFKTWLRFSLQAKLLSISFLFLLIPWLCFQYVLHMEEYLRAGQEQVVSGTAKAIATALHERDELFNPELNLLPNVQKGRDLHAIEVQQPIQLDGLLRDWKQFPGAALAYGEVLSQTDEAEQLKPFTHRMVRYQDYIYAVFEVTDKSLIYRDENALAVHQNDNFLIGLVNKEGGYQRYIISPHTSGWVTAYSLSVKTLAYEALKPIANIQGAWRETRDGFNLELRIPADWVGDKLGFAFYDVDDNSSRALHQLIGTSNIFSISGLGTFLTSSAEIEKILKGLNRANLRIWVLDQYQRVQAKIGNLGQLTKPISEIEGLSQDWLSILHEQVLDPLYQLILNPPQKDFIDELKAVTELGGKQVDQALLGKPAADWYITPDDKAVVLLAAHPVWVGGRVIGAVVAEQTTHSIETLRNQALEELFDMILLVIAIVTLAILLFARQTSRRILQLKKATENAVDDEGRIRTTFEGSGDSDELGDLSRSFSSLVKRLHGYTQTLENMNARLSHEFRTPISVVRSSLDRLAMGELKDDARVYVDRALEGTHRLNRILNQMSEASGLEQSLQTAENERIDLSSLVAGCVQGYQIAFDDQKISHIAFSKPIFITACPDHLAQMLDKVVSNAIQFALPQTEVIVKLERIKGYARIIVSNKGVCIDAENSQSLFDSMISVRSESKDRSLHLGLGLYIARTITEFYKGSIAIENEQDASGVNLQILLPLQD